MKKTLLILFVAFAMLTSCKKDKDSAGKLQGRWNKTKTYSVEYENGVKDDENTEAWLMGEEYIVFEGSNFTLYEDGEVEDKGTFSVTDNTITLSYDGESDTYPLRWNSSTEIVVTFEDNYTYNGKNYRDVTESTYKKH